MDGSGQLHASAASLLLPRKEPGIYLIGGHVGLTVGLDILENIEICACACAENRTPNAGYSSP
jgi:hypothetical protein